MNYRIISITKLYFSPSCATTVMQSDQTSASQRITSKVLDSHISCELAAILKCTCFPIRTVRTTYVVMVSTQDHGPFDLTGLDG